MALLEVSNLGIAFGGLQAVAQLDLSIEKGHLYGLIGPNGAGKTTVFNMLTGVYKPTEGNIILDGKDITGTPHDGMLTVTASYDGFVLHEEEQTEMQSVTTQTSAKE